MESLRGAWGGMADTDAYDPDEDEIGHEGPPPAIGQDERRMQVRAYNHWASLLGDRTFPLVADLETGQLPDFDPFAVLLDVSAGNEDPVVRYIGAALAAESDCDITAVRTLADVPGRSLLSRITDHYMQIIANQAPIGFEAEFVNQQGRTILYRGILLPFSGSMASEGIDLIYGVINWKELADQQTTDALMLAIDQALTPRPVRERQPLTAWADGPADLPALDEPLELAMFEEDDSAAGNASLADLLAAARKLARTAHGAEDRTRQALYAAIGRAFDFALAAAAQPDDFNELVADAGLTMQDRAPLIPVVKLVFGADYDKTRLTEYAAALAHGQRLELAAGSFAAFLAGAPGGLKGVVQAERAMRREEAGDAPKGGRLTRREEVAQKLRALPTRPFSALPRDGDEFTLVLARRTPEGDVVLVGEVASDPPLLERAARMLLD